ncbi:ligase-associated DNA damage response exonuclease [Paracoccus cavernae]|uniref:ligase-associated DNA damage response exonuclease n=1 Tax=Paracoccus cavernae TaxID=1571207 RepID=UPI0035F36ADF
MRAEEILHPRPEGLYCPLGDFFIDPIRPVERALITHAHADHARAGHGKVLASRQTLEIMAIRYGEDFARETQAAEGEIALGDVSASFHPAGHILGSCQIRLLPKSGPRIVVSGDYSRRPNPVCAPFTPLECEVFITEATFGLPVFRHPDPAFEIAKLLRSMEEFPDRHHLIGGYALGKTQRLIALLRAAGYDAPIGLHGALIRLCQYHISQGIDLGHLVRVDDPSGPRLVIAPPSAFSTPWVQRFKDPVIGYASGWMGIRARARQRRVELPLVISDHVDWPELTGTLQEIAPQEVWVTHGTEDGVLRWCALNQLPAKPLRLVGYEDEPE